MRNFFRFVSALAAFTSLVAIMAHDPLQAIYCVLMGIWCLSVRKEIA